MSRKPSNQNTTDAIAIKSLATNVVKDDEGIWVAGDDRNISYPESHHQVFFGIEEDSFWFNHRNTIIGHVVDAYFPGGLFIDIGGGNDVVADHLRGRGVEAVVLEPIRLGAINAKKRGLPFVICSTVQELGLKPGSVPSFGLFDVLEHIEDDAGFLQMLYDYLIPGGFLYLTVPAYRTLWSVDDVADGHYRRYTSRTLATALGSAGFTIRFASYFFSFLPPAIFLMRTVPSILRLRRGVTESQAQLDHSRPSDNLNKLLDWFLRFEVSRITSQKAIQFGSSCIAVVEKPAVSSTTPRTKAGGELKR